MAAHFSSGLRAARVQFSSRATSTSHSARRYASDFSRLQAELPARRLPLMYEDFTPEQSRKLSISLAPFIQTAIPDTRPPPASTSLRLPPAHHLVYNNPIIPSDKLLPDGTDPLQSPGPPFVRRMWAGGSVRAGPKVDSLTMDGGKFVTLEGIRDVIIKGKPGQEKVFVGIERRMAKLDHVAESEDSIRARLWTDTAEDFGDAALVERRNIVFMYERTPEELAAIKEGKPGPPPKMLKPQNAPDFTHTITPNATLLFRYSALTFNAHAIHLDPLYCRTVEGHRNLLFHGPLSFTFLVSLLGLQRDKSTSKQIKKLVSVEYRNLAPLYAWEPIRFCGREMEPNKYEIWAETPEGGIAVKGTAVTSTDENAVGMSYSQ